jgi:carbon starvation protein
MYASGAAFSPATARIRPLTNKYAATLLAVVLGGAMAMMPGPKGPGSGGLILWPLFGAVNQLLAGLALMVTLFYLWRRGRPVWFIVPPMLLLLTMPVWAMLWQMFNPETGWFMKENYLLLGIGGSLLVMQAWMIVEGILVWRRAKGVLEEALPPLKTKPAMAGGRSC